MSDDSRDFAELMAAIVEPTSDADGLAALHRLFVRWHRREHEPGERHQRTSDAPTHSAGHSTGDRA
jgi:hypothetical protein